jgi:hypothetical protein
MKAITAALILTAALLGANYYFMVRHVGGPLGCLPCAALLLGGPLLLGAILGTALAVRPPAPRAPEPPTPEPAAAQASDVAQAPFAPPPRAVPAATDPDVELRRIEPSAVRLLGALQREGRLVDFLTEDISRLSDADVGVTTRRIQRTCGPALTALVGLEPVLGGREDDPVTIEPGYDATAVRLVGPVRGDPPYRGIIRHPGWRATRLTIPREATGGLLIAPAEVEVTNGPTP